MQVSDHFVGCLGALAPCFSVQSRLTGAPSCGEAEALSHADAPLPSRLHHNSSPPLPLHSHAHARVSALRDCDGEVYGLTYRVGRDIRGAASALADLLAEVRTEVRGHPYQWHWGRL